MLALAAWSLTYALHWIAATSEAKMAWLNATAFGIVVAPVAFFTLVSSFTGRGGWMKGYNYLLLWVIPAITLLVLWSDSLQGLFYGKMSFDDSNMLLGNGPWFYVFIFYAYGLMATGIALLLRADAVSLPFYRHQTRVMLIGAALPWMVNFFVISGWHPLPELDLTPIAFIGTGLLFAYAFFGYRMMDLVPVARDVLVENIDEGLLVVDLRGRIVDINPKAMELATPGNDTPYGKPAELVFSRWADLIQQYKTSQDRFQVKLQQSPYLYLDIRVLPLKDRQGKIVGTLVTWHDITAQKQAEDDMRIFRHAVEQNPSMIVITDPEGCIEYVNEQFCRLTGFALEDIRGKTPRILRSGETSNNIYDDLWHTIKRGETWQDEILNRKKNGDLYWAQQLIAPVLGQDGNVTHFIAMQQDISERKHTETDLLTAKTRLELQLEEIGRLHEQLREEAIRDGVTRLFNRRYMEETLDRELSRADRAPGPISVVMMDVDRFKSINDTYGHQAGDTVLQTLGMLLLENTRISDIACRYGGDEMLVVMPGASLTDAVSRAEEWRKSFSLLEFSLPEGILRTSLSLGVASFPEHARSPIELLVAADRALYRAKDIRNTVATYDPATMSRSNNHSDNIR